MQVEKLLDNIRSPKLDPAHQRDQIDLLQKLNCLHLEQHDNDSELDAQITTMETAYQMQSAAMKTFDISREPAAIRELYGETPFARSCLLARRLVEDGVRFVTVYFITPARAISRGTRTKTTTKPTANFAPMRTSPPPL